MSRRLALLVVVLLGLFSLRFIDRDEVTVAPVTVAAIERPASPASAPQVLQTSLAPQTPVVALPWPVAADPFQAEAPPKAQVAAAVAAPPVVAPVVASPVPAPPPEPPRPTVFGLWRDEGRMRVFLTSTSGVVASAAVGDRVFAQYRIERIVPGAVTLLDESSGERLTLAAPQLPDDRGTAAAALTSASPHESR